jgi:predicted nucleic acid-binding protein
MQQIVIDTSVLIAALKSKRGASYRLLEMVGDARWQLNISVALALEYESVGNREARKLGIPDSAIDDIVEYCARRVNIMRFTFDCDRSFQTRTTNSWLNSHSWRDAISLSPTTSAIFAPPNGSASA